MKNIVRVMLAKAVEENITIFDSEFTRKLDAIGAEPDSIIKICHDVPKNRNVAEEEIRIHSELVDYLDQGYVISGTTYKCIMLTASDGRKATSTWLGSKYVVDIGKWLYCGLKPSEVILAVNKFMAYLGLLASASKLFSEVFDGMTIDVRRIGVIKDYYIDVEGKVDLASVEGVAHDVARKIHINAFDGFAIVRMELVNGTTNTFRIPWGKIMGLPASWEELKKLAANSGVEPVFVDYWGNKRHIDEVDMIITESCFKAIKLYRDWNQYADAFEKLGHNVCVCVQEHAPHLKGLPYQQGQTLIGDENDAQAFVDHSKAIMDKFSNPSEAASLLSGWHRRAAKIWPALLKEMHTKRSVQEGYTAKILDMMGGRIPELGYNAFLAPDIVAFAQYLFGLPVIGFLKAGECYCSNCKPGEVDVTRSPHLDNAHVILNNVPSMPLAVGPTMFINIWDLTTIRLRADYDGDHVWYSQHELLLTLVKKTYEVLNNLPIDWDAPSAPKVKITKGAIADFVSNLLHGSEIGLYADALTKMWNSKYDRDVCAWLTYAANVLIDAAKHGSVKIEQPEAVKALNEEQLPLFAMYAKADEERPVGRYWLEERFVCKNDEKRTVVYATDYDAKKHGDIDKVLKPRCAYKGSFLEMYSLKVDKQIPKQLVVKGLDDLIFNPAVMQIKSNRNYSDGRLVYLSKKADHYNPETKEYEGGGKFQEIAFRHAKEWKQFMKTEDYSLKHDDFVEAQSKEAISELIAYVRECYADNPKVQAMPDSKILDVAYDRITWNVFNTTKVSEGYDTVIKNAYWRIFGEMAYNTILDNLGEKALKFDPTLDYDDEVIG